MPPGSIVLYVEDDGDDRFFMQYAFDSAGIGSTLRMVPDGRVAIEYLSASGPFTDRAAHPTPQVVLLDLNLPQFSGFEVLEWIRKHPNYTSLPVVIFTSSAYPEDRARATALGATDYWLKPGSGLLYTNIVAQLVEKCFSPPATAAVPKPKKRLRH